METERTRRGMWRRIAWLTPPGIPLSAGMAAWASREFDLDRFVPTLSLIIFAPPAWLVATAMSSIWLAHDINRPSHPKDNPAIPTGALALLLFIANMFAALLVAAATSIALSGAE